MWTVIKNLDKWRRDWATMFLPLYNCRVSLSLSTHNNWMLFPQANTCIQYTHTHTYTHLEVEQERSIIIAAYSPWSWCIYVCAVVPSAWDTSPIPAVFYAKPPPTPPLWGSLPLKQNIHVDMSHFHDRKNFSTSTREPIEQLRDVPPWQNLNFQCGYPIARRWETFEQTHVSGLLVLSHAPNENKRANLFECGEKRRFRKHSL